MDSKQPDFIANRSLAALSKEASLELQATAAVHLGYRAPERKEGGLTERCSCY